MKKIIKATKPVLPDYINYISEIKDIWETGILTNNGPKSEKFKNILKEYTNCDNLELFVNGHSALMIAIKVLELKGEVITSPFTFVSTVNAIVQNGLKPVFCDIDDDYNVDASKIEEYITEKTAALVFPHIFGIPCNVDKIESIAKKYNIRLIYDAAQAFGTKINGKHICHYGDITMFSFHAIKVFNSIEGGLLAYKDDKFRKSFKLYKNFGISNERENDVEVVGINAKMNEFQAAMGILNLQNLDNEIEKRRKLANYYIEQITDIEGIKTYNYKENINYNYAYFPVKIHKEQFGLNRNTLWSRLKQYGIFTRKLYDKLCYEYSCYRNKGFKNKTPKAREIAEQTLDLPLYGDMTCDDISYICDCIKYIKKSN